ncbi:RNA polymerase subunit sigma-70 [Mycobacterium sp. djl-10]|nr:RNA polymerase subunit sigma-70 [Mycobacterium sp. djl-10]
MTSTLTAQFEQDVLPLRSTLLRGAKRLTLNDADAEDLLQETLLSAYRGFATFTPGTNVQAWLFRIMQNRWINNHRRAQCRPAEVALDSVTDTELAAGTDRTMAPCSPEWDVLKSLPNIGIRAAMLALPEPQRLVMYYAHVEGYAYAEIAEMLDIPIGTVMSRVFRARTRLRMALADRASGRNGGTAAAAA